MQEVTQKIMLQEGAVAYMCLWFYKQVTAQRSTFFPEGADLQHLTALNTKKEKKNFLTSASLYRHIYSEIFFVCKNYAVKFPQWKSTEEEDRGKKQSKVIYVMSSHHTSWP